MKDIQSYIAEMKQDGRSAVNIVLALKQYFGKHNIRFTYQKVEVDEDIAVYFMAWVLPNGNPETAIIFEDEPYTDWWGEEIR